MSNYGTADWIYNGTKSSRLLTSSMKRIVAQLARKFPALLYYAHKSHPRPPVMSQMTQVHNLADCSFNFFFFFLNNFVPSPSRLLFYVRCLYRYKWKAFVTYSRSWALFEEPLIVQPLKNFPEFYGTWRFNTVFTRVLHWSLSWTMSVHSTPSHSV
jgi:hypothetical protein